MIFLTRSFYECKELGKGCFLSNYKAPHGAPIKNLTKPCAHYSKVLIDKKNPIQDKNIEVEGWLELQIFRKEFKFDFTYTDENGQVC